MSYFKFTESLDQLLRIIVWLFISLEGAMLLADPQTRGRHYNTFSEIITDHSTLLSSLAEHSRMVIIIILLPTVFYRRGWLVAKFISILGYVFYICINCNLHLYNSHRDLKYLLVQIFIVIQAVIILVDAVVQIEVEKAKKIRKISRSSQAQRSQSSESEVKDKKGK